MSHAVANEPGTPANAPESTPAPETHAPWSAPARVGFRFLFAYLVLYMLPLAALLQTPVEWIGTWLLDAPVRGVSNGSGDTRFDYVALLVELALAAVVAIVWTVRDRRTQYVALAGWLHVALRYYLGAQMVMYGAAKVFPIQFPPPDLVRLTQPLGEFSPMGLLWAFMGHTYAFNLFTGLGEAVGGVLLFFRRTALAGALVLLAVLANVVVLNYAFDVPVKLFATHLMLMNVLLVVPNVRRLVDVFFLNHAAAPMWLGPTPSPAWQRARRGIKPVALALLLLGAFGGSAFVWARRGDRARSTPLYGVYDAELVVRNGDTLPPLATDSVRWQRVIFADERSMTMHTATGARRTFAVAKLDTAQRRLLISYGMDMQEPPNFGYARVDGGFQLDGLLDGDSLSVRLRRVDHTKFLLTSRGYHWVNEGPYNR